MLQFELHWKNSQQGYSSEASSKQFLQLGHFLIEQFQSINTNSIVGKYGKFV